MAAPHPPEENHQAAVPGGAVGDELLQPASWGVDEAGWVPGVRALLSPHRDARPEGMAIELLVIHNISLPPGEFGGSAIDDLFAGQLDPDAHPYYQTIQGLEVSAHFLIQRDGAVTQYVSCLDRAWHAGRSSWRGRSRCNDFSIGIELEGTDDVPFAEAQYASLLRLLAGLMARYPIEDIQGHEHIAPGRKTDPGPCFDWSRLVAHWPAQVRQAVPADDGSMGDVAAVSQGGQQAKTA